MKTPMIPIFGSPIPGVPLIDRPGAYAILSTQKGDIAIIRTERGCFLPGGGIEPGETPEAACRRELLEECGWEIGLRRKLGEAVDIFCMEPGNICYRIHAHYFLAEIIQALPIPLPHPSGEPIHTLLWLTPEEALPLFVRQGQAWAVERMKAEG